jgi:hypothetical protein
VLDFLRYTIDHAPDTQFFDNASANIYRGFRELRSNNFITDPIIETVLSLAILSIVPFSIVKRTKNGRLVYRKIQDGLWKYQCDRRGGHSQVNLTFEVARIAKALKVGLTAAYHEALKSEGDEPEE